MLGYEISAELPLESILKKKKPAMVEKYILLSFNTNSQKA